jgi:hypothetical protein
MWCGCEDYHPALASEQQDKSITQFSTSIQITSTGVNSSAQWQRMGCQAKHMITLNQHIKASAKKHKCT